MHPLRALEEKAGVSRDAPPRSWLFVPADSNKKLMKALECGADAVIFDLEDSVAPAQKATARELLGLLPDRRDVGPERWVRINPLGTDEHRADLDCLEYLDIDGVVLPKAENGDDVADLAAALAPRSLPVHAIVTETAASLFGLLSYRDCCSSLTAMSWGAEDLSAALGASSKYAAPGDLAFTYKLARSLCLAGAVAANVQPIDTVKPDFRDAKGLEAECMAARRAGFTGKMAIHPDQVAVINQAFTPSEEEVAFARRVVQLFADNPGAGTIGLDGKMLDMPHLKQAKRVLELAISAAQRAR